MTATDDGIRTNWGRWGADDERGALNLQTPATVRAASRAVRTGRVYALGLPIQRDDVPLAGHRPPPSRMTIMGQGDGADLVVPGNDGTVGIHEDVLVLPTHNETHLDALCHISHHGQLYNGFPDSSVSAHFGATRCGVDQVRHVVGRGILLDVARWVGVEHLVPPHTITGTDLAACAAAQGVDVREGDVLLVRTGWLGHWLAHPDTVDYRDQPGLGLDACDFVHDTGVSAVGADNRAIEAQPYDRGRFLGVHVELLVRQGVVLMEHLVLDELAADGVQEFLFVAAPLPITGGMGSPLNPLAIA